jgi:protocatechuate 3,4-dioxygenase beta subunit
MMDVRVLGLLLRGVIAVAIIAAAVVAGEELRAARAQLATGHAASAGTPAPTTQPVTPAPKPTAPATSQSQPTAPPAARTVVPTPVSTPFTGVLSVVAGTVTAGGTPVRAAQVMVYPSNSFNHGPTPMPPESGRATTDDRGRYQVSVPPGAYRIGVFRSYDNIVDPTDGFAGVTWYGDGYTIGFGRDLVVSGNVSADIAMLRVVKVAGRVVGRDGVGVPNARVGLSRSYAGIDFPLVPLGLAPTDRTGAFNLAIAAMPLTLHAQASGPAGEAWATMDLDLRADRTDLVVTIDRGNIVGGTLRDAAGRPLPNTGFGVWSGDTVINCASCGGQSDGAGRFLITIPSATVRFRSWPRVGEPELFSKDYVISGDLTLDPVLQSR